MTIILIIILGGILMAALFIHITYKMEEKNKAKIAKVIAETENFEVTHRVEDMFRFAFLSDDKSKRILFYDFDDRKIEESITIIPYQDIVDVELVNNSNVTSHSKSTGKTIADAAVGGVIGGQTGAIIGGLSGSTEVSSDCMVRVRIIVRNQAFPSLVINCFQGNSKDGGYELGVERSNQIYDICTVILDAQKGNELQSSQMSVADELMKLAKLKEAGILSEDEFLRQKEKLLVN